jgi:hypothetical protein
VLAHGLGKRALAGVAEGRMPEIVGERQRAICATSIVWVSRVR